jgi:hypothetical protein
MTPCAAAFTSLGTEFTGAKRAGIELRSLNRGTGFDALIATDVARNATITKERRNIAESFLVILFSFHENIV